MNAGGFSTVLTFVAGHGIRDILKFSEASRWATCYQNPRILFFHYELRTVMNRPLWSGALVLGLAVILVVLAVLQYRWSGQIMEADRKHIEAGLQSSVGQFRRQFNRELQDIGAAFHLDPSAVRDGGGSLAGTAPGELSNTR